MKSIIQRINDLSNYLSLEYCNRDLILEIICNLHQFNDEACKFEYTKQQLGELITSNKYQITTDKLTALPGKMVDEVKNLRQEIIDAYGLQD